MEMPLPDNTAPMMTGDGPFGNIGMGGMFSVVKVRANQKAGDYKDPGWFKHPLGTLAAEWKGTVAAAPQPPARPATKTNIEVTVRKPQGHGGH